MLPTKKRYVRFCCQVFPPLSYLVFVARASDWYAASLSPFPSALLLTCFVVLGSSSIDADGAILILECGLVVKAYESQMQNDTSLSRLYRWLPLLHSTCYTTPASRCVAETEGKRSRRWRWSGIREEIRSHRRRGRCHQRVMKPTGEMLISGSKTKNRGLRNLCGADDGEDDEADGQDVDFDEQVHNLVLRSLMPNGSFGERAAGMFEELLQAGTPLDSIGSLVSTIVELSLGVRMKEDLNITIDGDTVKATLGTNRLDAIIAKRSKRKRGRGAATSGNEVSTGSGGDASGASIKKVRSGRKRTG